MNRAGTYFARNVTFKLGFQGDYPVLWSGCTRGAEVQKKTIVNCFASLRAVILGQGISLKQAENKSGFARKTVGLGIKKGKLLRFTFFYDPYFKIKPLPMFVPVPAFG